MLIDDFLPRYDAAKRHQTIINSPLENVYDALRKTDFHVSFLIRLLTNIRGISFPKHFEEITRIGFILLAEKQNEEICFGIVGKFWTLGSDCIQIHSNEFRNFQQRGFAKAVLNFSFQSETETVTLLKTETRILCFDSPSKIFFRLYWMLVSPFSSIIRKEMLRLIKTNAEKHP